MRGCSSAAFHRPPGAPCSPVYNVYTRSSKGVVVAESVPLTARVAPTIAARLKALAAIEDRSVSYLVTEALERYLADEEWQLAEIQAAVAEADAPDAQVVAQEDLERWAAQIGSNPDLPPPTGRPRGDRASAA
jgi:predicted transcriptional regulator